LDVIEDIITGLPVSDHDHGVNGLEFGDHGELYILVGGNTNAGVPGALSGSNLQKEGLFSAAALVAYLGRDDFDGHLLYDQVDDGNLIKGSGIEVFSSGLRNPYDLVLHSINGNIYATDNGPNSGYGKKSVGCDQGVDDVDEEDELNLLTSTTSLM
jgi:glucose/arabinose dehydrogenase